MPLGAGLGAFPQAYTRFDTLGGYERAEQAHNDYLQILADAGIVGLILGGLFLFAFFRQGFESSRVGNTFRKGVAAGAFAGCFGVLVHSVFDFVLHVTAVSVLFITLLAMLAASGREYKDDIREFDELKPKRRRRSASVTAIHERKP
jgi:O-antigen ligase